MDVLRHLEHVFPPPRMLSMPSAGVDISDASIKYVQFSRGKDRLELEHWGDLDVPKETVKRGDLTNPKELAPVLRKIREKCGVNFVRVSLPEERAYLFETAVKRNTPAKNMRSVLEFQLEENVPLAPQNAFFDYRVVEDDKKEGVYRVSVAVYARDTIRAYYDACRAADLIPLSFEVEAQAIARSVIREGDMGTYMIVDFGKTRTGVGVVHKGVLMFTSTIDVGGASLSDGLRRVIGEKEESEYTRIKNEQGILRTQSDAKASEALLAPISSLKDEISMRINYWDTHGLDQHSRPIEKIILCGGSVNLAGLPEYLTEEMEIPAVLASVWQNAFSLNAHVPPITRRYSYGYATAVGLALGDFIHDAS